MNTDHLRVFFYGLFMDEALLAAKGVRTAHATVGYVDGFGLHIGERATLLPEKGGRAYGVLMEVPAADLAALYSAPGVADYVAEPVTVNLPGEVAVSAVCYNLPAAKLEETNSEYAAALLELATRLGLPAAYLGRIRRTIAAGVSS